MHFYDFGKFDCFCNVADLGDVNKYYFVASNVSEQLFTYSRVRSDIIL